MWLRGISGLICVLALSSCSSIEDPEAAKISRLEEPVYVAPAIKLTFPQVHPWTEPLLARQLVTMLFDDREITFEAALEADQGTMQIVVMMPSGPPALTISWDQQGINYWSNTDTQPPISPAYILADIALIYAPEGPLSAMIGDDGVLSIESPDRRLLRVDGDVAIAIERPRGDPWKGRSVLNNHKRGYMLTIESQRVR